MVTLLMLITFTTVCFVFYLTGLKEGIRKTEEKMDAERRMFFGMQITRTTEPNQPEDANDHKKH